MTNSKRNGTLSAISSSIISSIISCISELAAPQAGGAGGSWNELRWGTLTSGSAYGFLRSFVRASPAGLVWYRVWSRLRLAPMRARVSPNLSVRGMRSVVVGDNA